MIIRISISPEDRLIIRPGNKIDYDTPYLEKNKTTEIEIQIAKELKVKPTKIFHHIKKFVGEKVKKGEILATRKGFITTKKIISPTTGIIQSVDHEKGTLTLLEFEDTTRQMRSYFAGEVTDVENNELKLKVDDGLSCNAKEITKNFGGKTLYTTNDDFVLLNKSRVNKMVIICESIQPYFQSKLEALGIDGIITLVQLGDKTDLPHGQIKKIQDFRNIIESSYPYCLADKESDTIYFYRHSL